MPAVRPRMDDELRPVAAARAAQAGRIVDDVVASAAPTDGTVWSPTHANVSGGSGGHCELQLR